MRLTIVSPGGTLCDAEADRVSLPGEIGSFTVLKGHAPLIAHLSAGEIVYSCAGADARIGIRGGFVKVYRDVVEVCAEPAADREKR